MMTEFSPSEQEILDDLVRRRATSFRVASDPDRQLAA